MRRRAAAVALAAVLGLAGSGCAEKGEDAEDVVDAIDATLPLSHRFSYSVATGDEQLLVQGIVEDAFRYKLQLASEGRAVVEQIVDDDTVGVRFLDTAWIERLTDAQVAAEVDQATDIEGATVVQALNAQRWVLDEGGAPSALLSVSSEAPTDPDELRSGAVAITSDPLFDARTALEYTRAVALRTVFVRYDPEAVEPTYRADEDPFPAPEDGSGVVRYDAVLTPLPSAGQALSGSASVFPDQSSFRRMAVFVDGGRVIRVMEIIGTTPRLAEDLLEYVRELITSTAPEDVQTAFEESVAETGGDPAELSAFLVEGLNTFRGLAGEEPIQFRTVDLRLQDFGAADLAVTLPTADVVRGSLAVLLNLGRKPVIDEAGGAPTAGVLEGEAPAPTTTPAAAPTTTAGG